MKGLPEALAHRILLIVGNYGSGKTELSLALANRLQSEEPPVALVDLDIVNPYFRSAEREKEMAALGVRVLKPTFAMTTVDVPALPADILTVFVRKEERVVFDVGGDDTGSAALGGYAPYLAEDDVFMLFVVNTRRPLTRDAASILDLVCRVENRSRQRVAGFVHNTNLAMETRPEDLIASRPILREVSEKHGAPIALTCGLPRLRDGLPPEMRAQFFPIEPMMRPDWMDGLP